MHLQLLSARFFKSSGELRLVGGGFRLLIKTDDPKTLCHSSEFAAKFLALILKDICKFSNSILCKCSCMCVWVFTHKIHSSFIAEVPLINLLIHSEILSIIVGLSKWDSIKDSFLNDLKFTSIFVLKSTTFIVCHYFNTVSFTHFYFIANRIEVHYVSLFAIAARRCLLRIFDRYPVLVERHRHRSTNITLNLCQSGTSIRVISFTFDRC